MKGSGGYSIYHDSTQGSMEWKQNLDDASIHLNFSSSKDRPVILAPVNHKKHRANNHLSFDAREEEL